MVHFFDEGWTPLKNYSRFVHKAVAEDDKEFQDLGAVEYNEISKYLYFVDRERNTSGTILSLHLANITDKPHIIHHIERLGNEQIQGIAYDPSYNQIFWTDERNGIIYRMSHEGGTPEEYKILLAAVKPHGIAIDACRR